MKKPEEKYKGPPMRPDGKECHKDCEDCPANEMCNGQDNMIGAN